MRKEPNRSAQDIADIWMVLIGVTIISLALGACQSFVKPENIEQRLAYAYGTHTAVMQAAATSVSLGELTPEQGETVLVLADRSRIILDSARVALSAGDPTTAEGQLLLAIGILTEIQNFLRRVQ